MKRVVLAVEDSNAGVKARLAFFGKGDPLWIQEISVKQSSDQLDRLLAENAKKKAQKKRMPHSRDYLHSIRLEYRWRRRELHRTKKHAVAP